MRILLNNRISSIAGSCLTSYLGSSAKHLPSNVLTDIPSIKWISDVPVYSEPADAVSAEISGTIKEGFNGVYLGGLSADSVEVEVSEISASTSSILFTTGYIKTRVFPSIPHLFQGNKDKMISDLLFSVADFPSTQQEGYFNGNLNFAIRFKSDFNTMQEDLNFYVEEKETITGTTYSILKGHIKSGNNYINVYDERFGTNRVVVGCTLYLKGLGPAKVLQILGDGGANKSIDLLINKSTTSSYFTINKHFAHLSLGVLRIGDLAEFPNPQQGLSKTYKDYSKRKELPNGNYQYRNRALAKNFSGNMILNQDQLRNFFFFAEEQRAKPFPVEILTGMESDFATAFFGYFTDMPQEGYSQRRTSIRDVNFSIKQIF